MCVVSIFDHQVDVALWPGRPAAEDAASDLTHAESIQSKVSSSQGSQGAVEYLRYDALRRDSRAMRNITRKHWFMSHNQVGGRMGIVIDW